MNIKYTWRNAAKSDAVEELLEKKLEKLDKHEDHVSEIHVVLESINKQEHTVKANAHLKGIEISAHATAENMYKAIDDMAHKLVRQIESHKTKHMEHRHDHRCCGGEEE